MFKNIAIIVLCLIVLAVGSLYYKERSELKNLKFDYGQLLQNHKATDEKNKELAGRAEHFSQVSQRLYIEKKEMEEKLNQFQQSAADAEKEKSAKENSKKKKRR